MSMAMIYTEFAKDIEKYLIGKLPEMPEHTAQEIGSHISNKVVILVSDMMREYDRELKWNMSRHARRHKYGEYVNDLREVKNNVNENTRV